MADSDEESLTSLQEYELDNGIPQHSDPFIQKYMAGRSALITQEKRQRHDRVFLSTMTPLAKRAAKILSAIRARELRTVWSSDNPDPRKPKVHPGMMFSLARDRAESTDLFRALEKMPKGALLHAHLDAMFEIDWLVDQNLATPGMCILAPERLDLSATEDRFSGSSFSIKYFSESDLAKSKGSKTIWEAGYIANTPTLLKDAARGFPGNSTFKKWLAGKCMLNPEETLDHHHGLDAIWRRFETTFPMVEKLITYEPIFRKAVQKMLSDLWADGIMYVETRMVFLFGYYLEGKNVPEKGYGTWFEHFGEEVEKFKAQNPGFQGVRMIWTVIRAFDNKMIAEGMRECIAIKKRFPGIISGFDCVAQEDNGRPLADLVPVLFWFRKQCAEEGVDLPFFFHAGECLGDGDSTDQNLFDAILLGTRRIGHGYSLYKHPLLIDMVKERKILVESCPISNEVLRLNSSVRGHVLPALLSRGVSCSLNNDDPCILGYGRNGLTHDFWGWIILDWQVWELWRRIH